jgi:hypothetical protein
LEDEGHDLSLLLHLYLILALPGAFEGQTVPASRAERFKSPGGKFEVVFEEVEHRKFSEADLLRNLDQVSHIRYRISFQEAGEQTTARRLEYADVYGWEREAKPTLIENLFKAILWSPDEDYAMLDAEGWASAPGPPDRRAVALNRELQWSVAPFRLTDLIWADRFRVIGNSYADCDYSVVEFDGSTGQTRAIHEAESPVGYEIRTSVGKKALLRKVLDNCRTEDVERTFVPECLLLDLTSREQTVVPCEPGP